MSQFVVALKLTGDGRSAVSAVSSTRQALDQLNAGADATSAKAAVTRARLEALEAAFGRGGASSRDRAADIAAYGQEMDRLRARIVPGVAAIQAFQREQDEINHAHRVGAISAQEQSAALAELEARYRSAGASAQSFAAAANDNRRAGNVGAAHTTNLLFQAQDIAMMTAMGQAPMMLAMQQGMQVGGIFHQIGSGRQIVQALGGALVGLLNPLNLATIATIGLGAAGVQWFMSTLNSAEDATDALEEHRKMLDSILEGYDAAKGAADQALASALKLPQGVVASDLRATLRDQANSQDEIQSRIEANREALAETVTFLREIQNIGALGAGPGADSEGIRQVELLGRLAIGAASSREELHGAMVAARELFNTAEDPAIAELADQAYQLALRLLEVQARADSAGAALRSLPREIQVRIAMSESFGQAMGEISSLYMDPRSQFDQAREQLDAWALQAEGSVRSMSEATAFATEYQRVLDSINVAEAEANEKANARGAKAAQKPFDQWQSANDNFQQRIDQQRLEIELLGKSTYEVERQKAAFDLRNQARAAGIPIDETVNAQIERMAQHYAGATVELERLQERERLANEQMQFYRSTWSGFFTDIKAGVRAGMDAISKLPDDLKSKLSGKGGDAFEDIVSEFSASVESGAPAFDRFQEQIDAIVSTDRANLAGLGDELTRMANAARKASDGWSILGNAGATALDKIADRAIGMAANGLFDLIFGSLMGGIGGNSLGRGWGVPGGFGRPGIFGIPGFASGTDNAPAGLAWVGEEGPELVRFRGGEQVYNHTRSMGMVASNQNQIPDSRSVSVQIIDQRGRGAPIEQQRTTGPSGEEMIRLIVRDEVTDARRRGATGF
ncbi:phage tail length tape measure family protein [Devosia sediminis]|uniref:Phage tail length tape measure family protein n=1 Tax=Devosia sediminis TaxID=2798801 RepID=A0A934IWW5_9HYPH|nr:phage tail length tape measure family protein [Devosia sediminis]MBJ3783419.1 phage tail length tape measure family protein [Devosia sediminis]